MDDIRLKPCPICGGQPVVIISPGWPDNVIKAQCSICCRVSTPGIMFSVRGTAIAGRHDLLPDLATARRQAAEAWNEGKT